MTSTAYDVAIIGGGHNGLTLAAYLAKASRSAIVLEKNDVVGGAALTEEFHPGFRNSVAAYTVSLLNPKVIADLELDKYGLRVLERPAANFWPVDDSRYLLMPYGSKDRQKAIAKFSARDAERLPAYDAAMERAAAVLRDLALQTPPNAGGGLAEFVRSATLGRRLVKLGIEDQRVIADLFTQSAADFLDRWFESDVVKGALAFDAITGAYTSPYTPGTAYVLLHHNFGQVNGKTGVWGHAVGGMGAISDAIASAAKHAGATIRLASPVEQVLIEDGRAAGVKLSSGEVIRSRAVAANIGAKLLFRDLVPADAVAPELRGHFTSIKTGSGTFRMNVALSELPDFACRPGAAPQTHHGAGIVIGPTLDYLERAYMDARRQGWSKEPIVEILIPSTLDETLAPAGQHVASLFVQHVAPKLPHGRSWANTQEKAAFAELVIDTVARHAPNFRASIIASQVLSPLDLERRFGLIDGDIFQGQLTLDQLFSLRPVLGHANYRMPVPGLYLCGASGHPGGGVSGMPGHNCARELLRDLRKEPPWLRS